MIGTPLLEIRKTFHLLTEPTRPILTIFQLIHEIWVLAPPYNVPPSSIPLIDTQRKNFSKINFLFQRKRKKK